MQPPSPSATDQVLWYVIAVNFYAYAAALGVDPILPYPNPREPQNTLIRKVASITNQLAP